MGKESTELTLWLRHLTTHQAKIKDHCNNLVAQLQAAPRVTNFPLQYPDVVKSLLVAEGFIPSTPNFQAFEVPSACSAVALEFVRRFKELQKIVSYQELLRQQLKEFQSVLKQHHDAQQVMLNIQKDIQELNLNILTNSGGVAQKLNQLLEIATQHQAIQYAHATKNSQKNTDSPISLMIEAFCVCLKVQIYFSKFKI